MMRILGMLLLVGSLILIGVNIARLGSGTVAHARDDQGSGDDGRQAVVQKVTDGVARTVKFVVVPAALLLIGGVLINNTRRDDRIHELRVEAGEE